MREAKIITDQLNFPEGPVALADGRYLAVEVLAGFLTEIDAEGNINRIAELGGGPNGAAIGPDGRCYICNNGGITVEEIALLRSDTPDETLNPGEPQGRIEVVDLASGEYRVLYDRCDGEQLIAPNDLVFDQHGGFYFTDFGSLKVRQPQSSRVYYALADGSAIHSVATGLKRANGVGISPDEKTLYVSETNAGAVWAYAIAAPGKLIADQASRCGGHLLFQSDELEFDSLAVDSEGYVCVAALEHKSVARIHPQTGGIHHVAVPGDGITNICFGGENNQQAYITASISGALISMQWPCPGKKLSY